MTRFFMILAMLMVPVLSFAHDVDPNEVSRGSHIMVHIMENVFLLGFLFCGFVIYLIFKDIKKDRNGNTNHQGG